MNKHDLKTPTSTTDAQITEVPVAELAVVTGAGPYGTSDELLVVKTDFGAGFEMSVPLN